MKKILFISFILCGFSYGSFAQEQIMVACFDNSNPIMIPEGNNSTAVFGLIATAGQMKSINEQAALYPFKYTFKSEAVSDKGYSFLCTITFLHGEQLVYLHKTLLSYGIMQFKYNGVQYSINEMLNVIK